MENKRNLITQKRIQWLVILVVVLVIELICSWLSYYTFGWIGAAFSLILTILTIPIGLLYLRRFRWVELAILAAIALLTIPIQFPLTLHRLALQSESEQVVSYLDEVKIATGQYPPDLAKYTFHDPNLSPSIHYLTKQQEPNLETDFIVSYCIYGTICTSGYWYVPNKGWFYEDD